MSSSAEFDLRAVASYTSADLKSLLNDELGLHKMQFILDMLASQSDAVVRERRLSFLSRKITERINDYANLRDSSDQLERRLRQDLTTFLNESEASEPDFTRNARLDTPSFVYHRLDLIQSPPKLCKYFKQLATLDLSTLFLAANAFQKQDDEPILPSEETETTIQQLTKYLTECGNRVPNPGVQTGVRDDVMAISRISSTWRERSKTGNLSKYVVRRYMGSQSGAFLMYPGAVIDRSYHPHQRDWYRNAIANPGRVILTAPYLDVGGSGYIVTLSAVIREGRVSKGQSEKMLGVMGMDFTLGYFYKLLMQSIPSCHQQNITCFLMDDRGYLLAHASLIEPSGRGPVEYTHITHKEPLVANDLLNHKFFMKKQVCSSHADCTIQRFYSLNMSMESVLTNLVHGEHCSKYQITSIPESNIFVGVINKTCDTMTAFCPCSVVDRLCLNCHRMEQTDCECPCECPLETCPSVYSEENVDSSCSAPMPQELPLLRHDTDVPSCFQVECSTRREESECQGVLGCEWCQVDMTGQPLKRKFCNFQRQCFGGVLGVRTPYADELSGKSSPPAVCVAAIFMMPFVFTITGRDNHVRGSVLSSHSLHVHHLRPRHLPRPPLLCRLLLPIPRAARSLCPLRPGHAGWKRPHVATGQRDGRGARHTAQAHL